MANRVLRDWTFSENVDSLSYESEVFFTRLIMKADDYGKFHGSEKLLKAALFPLRNITSNQLQKMISECVKSGIIITYIVDSKQYIQILNFGQRLRVMNSKFPDCPTNDSGVLTYDSGVPLERKKETEDETEEKETEDDTPTKVDEINFDVLLTYINETFGRSFKVINDKVKIAYKKTLKQGYTKYQIMQAIQNAKNAPFHIENNYQYCTVEYFSRPKTIDLFSQTSEVKKAFEPIKKIYD